MYDTPSNIEDISVEELVDSLPQVEGEVKISAINRLKILEAIYATYGYNLSNDLRYFLLSENKNSLVLATAGGGKTTAMNIKVIMEKIVRKVNGNKLQGSRTLCLVYNKHNVQPFKTSQQRMVRTLMNSGIKNLNIDSEVNCKTFHGFCESWKKEYAIAMGFMNFRLLTEGQSSNMIRTCCDTLAPMFDIVDFRGYKTLLTFYTACKESMIEFTPEAIKSVGKFQEINVSAEFVIKVFTSYDNLKKAKRCYDFSDMLTSFYQLLTTNEKAREYIQNYYEYIVCDEFQDFTKLMVSILKIVTEKIPLVCIADEDQSIYEFRGADIYSTLDFSGTFENGKVFILSENRRCPKNITEMAKSVIGRNTLRYDKPIISNQPQGGINLIPFFTQEGEIDKAVTYIKELSASEREKTVVCYRDRASSVYLTSVLEREGITHNVLSGVLPFHHELYFHVLGILDLLDSPFDIDYFLNLFKVLPIDKTKLYKALGYNEAKKTFKEDLRGKKFYELDYGPLMNNQKFVSNMSYLASLSVIMKTKPMKEYIGVIFKLLETYYWNWKKSINNDTVDEMIEPLCKDFFNSDLLYTDFYRNFIKRKETINLHNKGGDGLTCGTFHSMKGLEFDNVIILDLNGNFPSMPSEIKDEVYAKQCFEAETRLFFVALTRAKKNISIYYPQDNPSVYVDWLKEFLEGKIKNVPEVTKEIEQIKLTPMNLDVNFGENTSEEKLVDNDFLSDSSIVNNLSLGQEEEVEDIGEEDDILEVDSQEEDKDILLDVIKEPESLDTVKVVDVSNSHVKVKSYLSNLLSRF